MQNVSLVSVTHRPELMTVDIFFLEVWIRPMVKTEKVIYSFPIKMKEFSVHFSLGI